MAITVIEERQKDLLTYLESQDFKQSASNATRLASKLETAIQRLELYDTHQLLRTIYFRFSNHKEKLKPLIDLLYYGARFLLANQEAISGQDVAALCLESSARLLQQRLDDASSSEEQESVKARLDNSLTAFHRANNTIDFDVCDKIARLANELPDTETGRSKFIGETFKLLTPKILNRGLLHTVLAKTYKNNHEYAEARYHYLHCANISTADEIGELLSEYHRYFGNKNEVDIFLAQFVLQFLCLQNPKESQTAITSSAIRLTVEVIMHRYKSKLRHLEPTPLLNFLDFITSLLDAPEPETFKSLCDIYKKALDRDPNYHSYLDRIGVIYFGKAPPPSRPMSAVDIILGLCGPGDE